MSSVRTRRGAVRPVGSGTTNRPRTDPAGQRRAACRPAAPACSTVARGPSGSHRTTASPRLHRSLWRDFSRKNAASGPSPSPSPSPYFWRPSTSSTSVVRPPSTRRRMRRPRPAPSPAGPAARPPLAQVAKARTRHVSRRPSTRRRACRARDGHASAAASQLGADVLPHRHFLSAWSAMGMATRASKHRRQSARSWRARQGRPSAVERGTGAESPWWTTTPGARRDCCTAATAVRCTSPVGPRGRGRPCAAAVRWLATKPVV